MTNCVFPGVGMGIICACTTTHCIVVSVMVHMQALLRGGHIEALLRVSISKRTSHQDTPLRLHGGQLL